jgi:ABC-type amino acid transport substrate-binding protein
VGALAGFSYDPSIDAVAGKLEFESDFELLEALRQGLVDVAVVEEGVALHLLDGDRDLTAIEGFATTRPLHLASRLDRPAIVDAFDLGLSRLGGSAGA